MSHTRLTSFAVGALLLAAVAPPAVAQAFVLRPLHSTDPADPTKIVRTAVIPYAGIDPTSPRGAEVLLQRIEEAADAVCGGAANAITDRKKEDYAACRGPAISRAVARMRSPALTALASQAKQRPAR